MNFHQKTPLLIGIAAFITSICLSQEVNSENEPLFGPQSGYPIVKSFEVPIYRHKGEVWSFIASDDGRVWIGAEGLHLFDGKEFESIELPEEIYTVRSLQYDDQGVLWIGSNLEIGHLEVTDGGKWIYHSNKKDLLALGIESMVVWDSFLTNEGVVFIGDHEIVRTANGKFECWKMETSQQLRGSYDGKNLWIINRPSGLLEMTENGPKLVISNDQLPENQLLSWALEIEDKLIIGTATSVFRKDKNEWIRLDSISDHVANLCPWRAVYMDKNVFALGTTLGGTIICDIDDNILQILDTENGLPSDWTISLWFDTENGGLWIGQNGGLSQYNYQSSTTIYNHGRNFAKSPPFRVVKYEDQVFFISVKSISELLPPKVKEDHASIREIMQFPSPISDAIVANEQLWVGSFGGGVYMGHYGGNELLHVPERNVCKLFINPIFPDKIFYFDEGILHSLTLTEEDGNKYSDYRYGFDLNATPNAVVVMDDNSIWVNTVQNGCLE